MEKKATVPPLRVSEYFYSVQGEGVTAGVPAFFIRLGGCNLLCGRNQQTDQPAPDATWECDTIAVWRKSRRYTPELLVQILDNEFDFLARIAAGAHVVFTGGEPLMQQDAIVAFMEYLDPLPPYHTGGFVEVETNGTIEPGVLLLERVNQWNVSPKLSNSGQPLAARENLAALRTLASVGHEICDDAHTMFKFVISSEADMVEVLRLVEGGTGLGVIHHEQVVLMPAASDIVELHQRLPMVADLAKAHTFKMCSRMQIEVWNQLTGV